jgi:hypothetical protein
LIVSDRTVKTTVLRAGLYAENETGDLAPALFVTIEAETKKEPVTALYLAINHKTFWRFEKLGTPGDTYTVALDAQGEPADCTCPSSTMRPERGVCKHQQSVRFLQNMLDAKHK